MTSASASPNDDELSNRLKQIFASPEVAKKVIQQVTTKKPPGWGRKSTAPYYKEAYGNQIREMADEMIKTKQSIVFDYERFCYDRMNPSRMSERTLYLRVNQSINFLLEEIDPYIEGQPYAHWHAMCKVRVDKHIGVLIEYIPELVEHAAVGKTLLSPKMVSPTSDKPKWRLAMRDWLDNDEDQRPFVKENLVLTKEERLEIEAELAGLGNLLVDVETTHVKLVKMQ